MYGFIGFGFKIIFAAIIGGSLNYVPGKESNQYKIIETSLICIFGAAILALSSQFTGNGSSFAMGFGILSVIIGTVSIAKDKDYSDRIIWYFSAVSGMIIGTGYIFQASILIILIYTILRNSERLLNFIHQEDDHTDDNVVENITN